VARFLYSDPGSHLVYQLSGRDMLGAVGRVGTLYEDSAGTILADIAEYVPAMPNTPGPVIASSQLTVDSTSRLPWFWGPASGLDTLYVTVNGGPLTLINAYYDPRIDAAIAAGGVNSFNGRVGVVLPAANDYAVADINGLTAALGGKASTAHAATHLPAGSDPLTTAIAGSSAVGDTAAAGTAQSFALSDHRHGRESFGAVTAQTSFGASSANGVATTDARSDHAHGTPAHGAAAHSAISLSDLAAPTADLSIGSHKLTNVSNGSGAQDAAAFGQIIPASLVDAAGDILVATADNTVARKAIGSAGRVLTVDTSQSDKLRWASIPGLCPLVAGRWYVAATGTVTTAIPAEATEKATPLYVGRSCTLTGLAVSVTVVGTSGAVVRLGIRADNSGEPGSVLYDSGGIDAVSSTGVKQVNPALAVTEGQIIWLSATVQGGAGTRPTISVSANVHLAGIGDTSVSTLLANHLGAYQATGITGALPSSPSWAGTASAHRVAVTAAA